MTRRGIQAHCVHICAWEASLSRISEMVNSVSIQRRAPTELRSVASSLFATKVRAWCVKVVGLFGNTKMVTSRRNPKGASFGMDLCARVCSRPERSFQQAENVSGTRAASSPLQGIKTCLPKPKRKGQVAGEDSAAQGNLRSHSDRFYS